MAKCLTATLTLLVFMASQSFAAVCADACRQSSIKIQPKIVNTNAANHDCHGVGTNNQPAKSDSSHDCGMNICVQAQSDIPAEVSAIQAKDKDGTKNHLAKRETPALDFSVPLQTAFLDDPRSPLPQKMRLHLRIGILLI